VHFTVAAAKSRRDTSITGYRRTEKIVYAEQYNPDGLRVVYSGDISRYSFRFFKAHKARKAEFTYTKGAFSSRSTMQKKQLVEVPLRKSAPYFRATVSLLVSLSFLTFAANRMI
jgi:hypothetical protein